MLQKRSSGSVEVTSIDKPALLNELEKIAEKIALTDPKVQTVLLHGSLIQGRYTPESDLDILIIVTESQNPFLTRRDEFLDLFLALPMDVDIKVYTEQEIQEMQRSGNAFLKGVLSNSRTLYSRHRER